MYVCIIDGTWWVGRKQGIKSLSKVRSAQRAFIFKSVVQTLEVDGQYLLPGVLDNNIIHKFLISPQPQVFSTSILW